METSTPLFTTSLALCLSKKQLTKYVLCSIKFIQVKGRTVTLHGGERAYLGDSDSDSFFPHSFH